MWSDKESSEDYLNFGEVSQLAVDVLTTKDMLPVSIGIFGNWGAGKSSLLKLIEQKLEQDDKDWIVINFDSWLYQGYDDARAALLEVIATELTKAAEGNSTLISKTKRLLSRVDGFRAMGLLAEGTALMAGLPTGGLLSRGIGALRNITDGIQSQEEYEALGNIAKEGKETACGLIKPQTKKSPPQQIDAFRKEYGEILEELGKPLIVVIDNLDRCLPANAIHTLEVTCPHDQIQHSVSNVGIFILRMTLSPARCKFRRCLIIQRGVRAAFVIILPPVINNFPGMNDIA